MSSRDINLVEKIERLRQHRAGSIFSIVFESGWIYGMLFALGKEPDLRSREDVEKWIKQHGACSANKEV